MPRKNCIFIQDSVQLRMFVKKDISRDERIVEDPNVGPDVVDYPTKYSVFP